jgi:hypothetical protein
MSIFDNLGTQQEESIATKDDKGNKFVREDYFTLPKNSKGQDYPLFKLDYGINVIDILPFFVDGTNNVPIKGPENPQYKIDLFVYRNIGQNKASLPSNIKAGLPDPIADLQMKYKMQQKEAKTQEEKDKIWNEKIKPLNAQRRCLYLVLHHTKDENGKAVKIPKVWDYSHFGFEEKIASKLQTIVQRGKTPPLIAHPVVGKTIIINTEKDSFNGNEFPKIIDIEFEDRDKPLCKSDDEAEAWIAKLPKLDLCIKYRTKEEIEKLLFGMSLAEEKSHEELDFTESKKTNDFIDTSNDFVDDSNEDYSETSEDDEEEDIDF